METEVFTSWKCKADLSREEAETIAAALRVLVDWEDMTDARVSSIAENHARKAEDILLCFKQALKS